MTDKEIEKLLRDAYKRDPSGSEKSFLKRYETGPGKIWDVIWLEIKYLGSGFFFMGIIMLAVMSAIVRTDSETAMWNVSSALPAVVLVFLSALGRSERYRMEELEASCRFSVKFIRSVRLMILGVISIIIIGSVTFLLRWKMEFGIINILSYVATPYLFNVWGNILITRKWHSKENLLGCLGITAMSCALPHLIGSSGLLYILDDMAFYLAFVSVMVLTFRECADYIKESEELSWNY